MPAPTKQLDVPKLRTRRPTGKPAWPRILLSGEEGAHKSTEAARLSADKRIGRMFWMEVGAGENTADEYGAIDGVTYEIIDHDGTWKDIYGQLCAAWDVAKEAEKHGEPVVALSVDAAHGVYGMLSEWGDLIARRRLEAQIKRDNRDRRDPSEAWSLDTEAQRTPDVWNSINRRWGQFMAKVLTWPGPVVLIAAEKLVTPFVNGQPDPRAPKEWTMDGSPKTLPRQCTSWVRMTRGNPPMLVKLRSAKEANAVADGEDRPVARPDFSCAKLIFDWIGCEAGVSRAPVHKELDADQEMPGEGAHEQAGEATAQATQTQVPRQNDPTTRLLDAPSKQAAEWWKNKIEQLGDQKTSANRDVIAVDDLEVLGIDPEGPVLLGDLAEKTVAYWDRHGFGPRIEGSDQDGKEASDTAAGQNREPAPLAG